MRKELDEAITWGRRDGMKGDKLFMPLFPKKYKSSLLQVKTKRETIFHIGGSFTVQRRQGSYCMAEARSTQQIWEDRVCIAEAHGIRGFPPSSTNMFKPALTLNTIKFSMQLCFIFKNVDSIKKILGKSFKIEPFLSET